MIANMLMLVSVMVVPQGTLEPVFQFNERHEITLKPAAEGQVSTSGQFYSRPQDAVDIAYEVLKELGFERDVDSSTMLLPYVNGIHKSDPLYAAVIFHPEQIKFEVMANSAHVEEATRDLMLTLCRVLGARFMQKWEESLAETRSFSREQRSLAHAAKQKYLDNFRSKVDWQAAVALFGTAWLVSRSLSPPEEASGSSRSYSSPPPHSPPPSSSAKECLEILREDQLSNGMRYIQFKCPRRGDWVVGAGRFLYQKESGKWGTTKGVLGRVYSSPAVGLRKECGCD